MAPASKQTLGHPARRPRLPPTHPGEILRTEFLEPMGVTAYQLAKALHFPGIYDVVREEMSDLRKAVRRQRKRIGI